MKILLRIFLVVLLGVAAFEGYVWYKVRATVAELVDSVSPVATVYYGQVVSSIFPREMGVDDLEIRVQGQTINIESIRLKADSIWDLYAIEHKPEKLFERGLAVEMRGLDFTDYYTEVINTLTDLQADSGDLPDPCGAARQVGISDLKAMGFSQLLVDAELAIPAERIHGPGRFSISGRIQEQAEFTLDLDLLLESSEMMAMAAQLQEPDIQSIALSVRDLGYSAKWIDFCARKRDLKPEIFTESHLLELQEMLALDYDLGLKPGMLEAYRAYLVDGSRVRVELQPQTDQWVEQLAFYQPDEYAQLLGLGVFIEGRRVLEAGFSAPPKVFVEEEETVAPSAETEAVTEVKPVDLQWSDLEHYSELVEVKTRDGERYVGRVTRWNSRRVMLQKRVGSGFFSFPILSADFQSAHPHVIKKR